MIDNLPRCDCGHLFEICNHPNCTNGIDDGSYTGDPRLAVPMNDRSSQSPGLRAYRVEHDGFEGVEIGSYTTLEGKEGAVLQQVGTRVVHVYGRKWLSSVSPDTSTDRALKGE
jgi:hypothetical protein